MESDRSKRAEAHAEHRGEWEEAWAREADRREAQIAAGAAQWLSGPEVLTRIRKALAE
jgi:hypothetical protein